MKNLFKRITVAILSLTILSASFVACKEDVERKKVVIYTSAEDYRIEYMQAKLDEQFPDYDIIIDYKSSGDHAAFLKASGTEAGCDITHDLEYGYAHQIADLGLLADLSEISDFSVYTDDAVESSFFLPEIRSGGAVILNMDIFEEKQLDIPESYTDLLDPQYEGLISMPNPASSGTGYMFLLSLVNAWGEEEAFKFFDDLVESGNLTSFTSSGSGPVNALIMGEAAIGLGMTANAVTKINEDGANFRMVFFEEGSPYSIYGQAIIKGRETDAAVVEVFRYLSTTVNQGMTELYFPEKIYRDREAVIENYPKDIKYADMSDNTPARKDELLKKWNH
ncbi:MAG: extracellular solute-binding protein [Clostridia bacterium]|nr:extracellular solute-binding protein [Clostridia bacterium]